MADHRFALTPWRHHAGHGAWSGRRRRGGAASGTRDRRTPSHERSSKACGLRKRIESTYLAYVNSLHGGYDNTDRAMNPTQEATLALLGSRPEDRPVFDPGIGASLDDELSAALADIAARIDPAEPLFISKYVLARVHSCERLFVDESEFEWSPPLIKGSVAHKAIELGIHRRSGISPLDLVDDAIASLSASDGGVSDWLSTCPERERDEVRALSVERVAAFFETFPPIRPAWKPVTEGRIRVELHGGRFILQGRPDLTLGTPDGTRAGKVLIDFKTGRRSADHVADLRFYALVETIRLGTPPRLLATYYLDSGRAETEQVGESLLEAALRRTADGARKVFELRRESREPVPTPGPACRWCPVLPTCREGQHHLESLEDDGFD